MVLFGETVKVPVLVTTPHPPVKVIVYGKTPDIEDVPEMVTVFAEKPPITPDGKPEKVAPIAPVVV